LIPLGRLLIQLRLLVIAALVAASPMTVVGHAVENGAGYHCASANDGALCHSSGQRQEPFAAVAFLNVEETSDQFEDFVPALAFGHSFDRLAVASAKPHALYVSACIGGHCGRANPPTGPPFHS
jgi:hypothetical protein